MKKGDIVVHPFQKRKGHTMLFMFEIGEIVVDSTNTCKVFPVKGSILCRALKASDTTLWFSCEAPFEAVSSDSCMDLEALGFKKELKMYNEMSGI